MRRLAVLAGVAAVAASAAAAAPASASAGGVELSEAAGRRFPDKTFVLTLPERRVLAPRDVIVRENGRAVGPVRVTPGDAAGARTFGTMLVIDASKSTRGAPAAAAIDAARRFAAGRPPGQRLGVIFFSGEARVALAPTTDRAAIAAALATAPPLSSGTQIYDAAALALRELQRARVSVGSIVVLSDGADLGSDQTPAAVAAAARRTRTRVFTIGLRSRSYDGAALTQLAAATGGRHVEASSGELRGLFAALGRRFGREYLLSYRSLQPLGRRVTVSAAVPAAGGAATASYRTPAFRAGAPATPAGAGFWGSTSALAVAAAIAALLVALACFVVLRPARGTVQSRITTFTGAAVAGAGGADGDADAIGAATRPSRLERLGPWMRFAEDVDVAGLEVAPRRLAAVAVLWSLAAAALAVLLTGNAFVAAAALGAPAVVLAVVRIRADRQRRAFESQLADNLQVVASAMRAGQTFVGALAVAVEDAHEPARRELQRTVSDERLGVPLDEAIGRTARRMRSKELEYVGLVATLQRETGGNTAEVVDRVTETIRERAELNRLIRTLTAQGRFGGGLVSVLPIVMVVVLGSLHEGYFDPLLHSGTGHMLIGTGIALLTGGWLAIRRIVDIEV
ncbi:MAG TPA: VWA domain-containing protein [Solirubrobacteraceae bacterium]|nr:VWA domain-containing protein [Solirubrobacteraceae bacterium]